MNEKYDIRFWQDAEYAIYKKGENQHIFIGTLEEVNAWLSLKEKGFDI